MLSGALCRATLGSLAVGAALTGVAVAAGAVTPVTGFYASSVKSYQGSDKGAVLEVTKRGSSREIESFYIQCHVNNDDLSAVMVRKTPAMKVSRSGAFSYQGKVPTLHNGTLYGTATLRVTGRFVSSTKASGTATFTSKPKLSGCPGPSFTVIKLPK